MLNQQWVLIADRTKVLSASSSFFLSEKKMYDAIFFVWAAPRLSSHHQTHHDDHTQLGDWAIGQSGKKVADSTIRTLCWFNFLFATQIDNIE